MTIKCKETGVIPYPIAPDDEFQVDFDISTWMGLDSISSVAFSAVDEDGTNSPGVLNGGGHDSAQTIQPYLKGGGTDHKSYTVKCKVTTLAGYKKSFYVKFSVDEIAAAQG
jgi:hypothetical protein